MKQFTFSSRRLYTALSLVTFLLLITAQVFWSAIHGDGAVYAWIIREVSRGGWLAPHLPSWDQTRVFAEHPYLFFYFGSLFTWLLGFSDVVMKLPNFLVALASVGLLYRAARLRGDHGHRTGLIAGYVLLFNATYGIQISQPSLDPLAQLLALAGAVSLIFYRRPFAAGLWLGLAFLTKGLEMLPHLAALGLLGLWLKRRSPSEALQEAAWIAAGVLLPLLAWLGYDQLVWHGQWLSTYWRRQFTERFLQPANLQRFMDPGFLLTLGQAYFAELLVLAGGLWFGSRRRRDDPFFIYFLLFAACNTLAFLLIKKDSSQHLTGILLFGALFVAEYLTDLWSALNWKALRAAAVFTFALTLGYWGWFMRAADRNPDMWTAIRKVSAVTAPNRLPIVVQNETPEGYGFFYTVQWYFPGNPVFSPAEADRRLVGQEVLLLADNGDGRLVRSRLIYRDRLAAAKPTGP